MSTTKYITLAILITVSLADNISKRDEISKRRGKVFIPPKEEPESSCPDGCKAHQPCTDGCNVDCEENLKCMPEIPSYAWTQIRDESLTENTILVCNPGSRIKRLQRLQSEYQANISCTGIMTKQLDRVDDLFDAVLVDADNKERTISLNVENYRKTSLFMQGSESYWSRAVITSGDCAGDAIIQYGQWVADNPLDGCTGSGVNHWSSVYYKTVIKGEKCCATCYLLQSAYALDRPLANS